METDAIIIRQHLILYGKVQGVGFRNEAVMAARKIKGLTGWVKNNRGRSVEMEVQGTPEQIELLLEKIQQHPVICIDRVERNEIPVLPDETKFTTAYG